MARLQVASRVDTASDLMTEWVVAITPSDSLLKARDLMTRKGVSQLVVVDPRQRPVGILSKRDIACFLLEDPTTRPLEEMLVSEASSQSYRTLRSNLPVFNAARVFDIENLAYAVVSNDQPLAGIMTETDLCYYFSRKFSEKFEVRDFMIRDFIFAMSTYPVIHVAYGIVFRQPGIPVIDEELVGILTLSDLLSIRERTLGTVGARLSSKSEVENDMALITTNDLMTRNPIITHERTDLAQAAQVMIGKGISSLPVLDDKLKVVGLLTKHDIVRALGRVGRSIILEP